jgi:hypothetical protein
MHSFVRPTPMTDRLYEYVLSVGVREPEVFRELREETSLEVEPLEFVGIWMDRYGSGEDAPATLNLYWTARAVTGEPEPADDVTELGWFATDGLPTAGELAFHIPEVLSAWRSQQASGAPAHAGGRDRSAVGRPAKPDA